MQELKGARVRREGSSILGREEDDKDHAGLPSFFALTLHTSPMPYYRGSYGKV